MLTVLYESLRLKIVFREHFCLQLQNKITIKAEKLWDVFYLTRSHYIAYYSYNDQAYEHSVSESTY